MTIDSNVSHSTTAIGSLPHHNVDAALEFAFRLGIPFLPQIPIRNFWEFMLAQALEGLPGLLTESDGTVILDENVWIGRARNLDEKLHNAFARTSFRHAFEAFEPSSATSSSWQPFLWELQERGIQTAKIQIAGPLTAQWVLRLKSGGGIERYPEIGTQIYRLVLARATAMSRRLQNQGVRPILYLDEPGLFGFSRTNPRHVLGLQELKFLIQALKKEKVTVGLHCCSNTDWESILGLDLDFLSIDAGLSLQALLEQKDPFERFIYGGGRLSLGIIPTTRQADVLPNVEELFEILLESFSSHWDSQPAFVHQILRQALYTPACGLALHTTADAEIVLAHLLKFEAYLGSTFIHQK